VDLDVVAQQALVDPAGMFGDGFMDAYAVPRVEEPFLDPQLFLDDRNLDQFLLFLIELGWVNSHGSPPVHDFGEAEITPTYKLPAHCCPV
jgi:hypothetical protein